MKNKKCKFEDKIFVIMLVFSILSYLLHALIVINNKSYALWTIDSVRIPSNLFIKFFPYIKDMIAIFFVIYIFFKYKKYNKCFGIFLVLVIYGTILLFLSDNFDYRYVLSGIRNLIFVFISVIYCMNKSNINSTSKIILNVLKLLILVEFYLVFAQAFNTGNVLLIGRERFRFSGSFGIATGLGYFIIAANLYILYMAYYNDKDKTFLNYIFFLLSLLIVIATGSRTSMFIESIIIFVYFMYDVSHKFDKNSRNIFALLIICIGLVLLPKIYNFYILKTGRGGLMISGDTRLDIMFSLFEFNDFDSFIHFLLGGGLGLGTNTAYSLGIKNALIMDGTISTLMAQFGIVGLLVFCVIVYRITKKLFMSFKGNLYMLVPLLFALMAVIFAGNIFEQISFIIIITYILFVIKYEGSRKNDNFKLKN